MWVCTDVSDIKDLLKEETKQQPETKNTYSSYREERCTCGTEYDFDGIPRRKECKRHGY